MRMWNESDSLWWMRTRGYARAFHGSGGGLSAAGREPNNASSALRAASVTAPPRPITVRAGTYQRPRWFVNVSRVAAPDRLLGADDVAAERRVAVAEAVVHAREIARRRVDVHVHLFDDHALLALDLLGVEERVQEHVAEHVDRDRDVLLRALDVVAGVLLAGERVELGADAIDLVAM